MNSKQQEYQEAERQGKTIIWFYEEFKIQGSYKHIPSILTQNLINLIKRVY